MAAGDAQRTWFPEMLEGLKVRWHRELSWEECRDLCGEMTALRTKIRESKNIKPVRAWCKNCQAHHNPTPSPLTIRSMLFALKKIGVMDEFEFKELDKMWKKYRKDNSLDARGQK
jgi:hypothetical protein